jgi:predicted glycosyltransferase
MTIRERVDGLITPFPSKPVPSGFTSVGGEAGARALFYSADVAGLGNVRRTMAIVHEVANLRPDAGLLLLTGGLQTHAYQLPDGFDYVKLPTAAKHKLFDHIPPSPDHPQRYGGLVALRERLAFETATSFAPHLILVDNLPGGLGWELTRTLNHLRAIEPRIALVLGLRDVLDEPARVATDWERAGHFALMEEIYDRILIYGCPEIVDPTLEYRFPPAVTAKMEICGYVRRPEPLSSPLAIREQLGVGNAPFVVVTVGGGHFGGPLLRQYLTALRERRSGLNGVISYVVIGPLLASAPWELADLMESARGLPNLHIVPFVDDLLSYVNAADVIVTMGGLTLVEAVSLGKRVIALPPTSARDQYVRAERLARLGACTWVPESEQTSVRLASAVRDALAAPSPSVRLDFDGRERVGRILTDLLPG